VTVKVVLIFKSVKIGITGRTFQEIDGPIIHFIERLISLISETGGLCHPVTWV
jgi:hypothetical protein